MSESDNHDDETLQERLDGLRAHREKILGSLDALGEDTSQSADSLDSAMKNSEELAKNQFGGITDHFKEAVKTSRANITGLGDQIKKARSSSYNPLRAYSWSTRIIWALLCFVLGTVVSLVEGAVSGYILSVMLLYVVGETANELYL